MDERQRYEQGMKVRRGVLGDTHVDASLKNRNEFNEAFQDLLTRYAWGEVWSRPGLPRQTRSMITLAMMVALNRTDELRMQLRGALNNGHSSLSVKLTNFFHQLIIVSGNGKSMFREDAACWLS
jgi:4-carboxymuconolactone decarboxylase